jgi:epoxyqueuosine reductase
MKVILPMTLASFSDAVKQAARELGFDLAGVAGVGEFAELEGFPEWIAEGRAGDMRYLEARNESGELKRAALRNVAPWAKSVVVVALNYNSDEPYSTECDDPARGWISRYAWSQSDYHDVILEKLRALETQIAALAQNAGEDFRSWCYVDTGPLVERVYAKYAGIGWIGKNTCILNQDLGSWLFLGVILTSLALQPDIPAPDRCGTCTACLDACPTNAFPAPYELDPTRCISYLTIEKRGPIPEDLREGIGRHVFGCDICQDVCPWNRKSPLGSEHDLAPRKELVNPLLDWLASLGPEEFRETFRNSPIKRAKLSGLRRNVVTAMGNSRRLEFISALQKLANDEDAGVAEHARWALRRLENAASDDRGEKD